MYNSMLLYSMFSVNVHLVDGIRARFELIRRTVFVILFVRRFPLVVAGRKQKVGHIKGFHGFDYPLICTIVSIRQYPILFAKRTIYN